MGNAERIAGRLLAETDRIFKNRFYLIEAAPGISGFQRWNETEYRLVTGAKARTERSSVVGEYSPKPGDRFRLEDGHLPEHQPHADADEAMAWLRDHQYSSAVKIG